MASEHLGADELIIALPMLREIDVAALKRKHVVVDKNKRVATVFLAVSKTGPDARVCHRPWGCLCEFDVEAPCAFHALL